MARVTGQQRLGFVTASATLNGLGLVRGAGGLFISMQSQVKEVNRQIALEIQQRVLQALDSSIVRPGVSTGRLHDALSSPENIQSDAHGWGFGSVAFLAQSAARYWNTIDRGSAIVWSHPFAGTRLRGIWGGSISGGVGAAPWSEMGAGEGGKFFPTNTRGAQARLRHKPKHLYGVVRHEIAPHLFFERGFQDFGGMAAVRAAYQARLGPSITFK